MAPDPEAPLDPGVAAFARRLTTRDLPPEPPRLDRASVEGRIAAGLRLRYPKRQRAFFPFLARVLYGFFEKPAWDTYDLSRAHQRNETTIRRLFRPLLAEGLLERVTSTRNSHYKFFRLTRAGEDWLQTLVQVPLPALSSESQTSSSAEPVADAGGSLHP